MQELRHFRPLYVAVEADDQDRWVRRLDGYIAGEFVCILAITDEARMWLDIHSNPISPCVGVFYGEGYGGKAVILDAVPHGVVAQVCWSLEGACAGDKLEGVLLPFSALPLYSFFRTPLGVWAKGEANQAALVSPGEWATALFFDPDELVEPCLPPRNE